MLYLEKFRLVQIWPTVPKVSVMKIFRIFLSRSRGMTLGRHVSKIILILIVQ